MKKLLFASVVIVLTLMAIPAFAQSAKEAIMALKKLQAKCQPGMAYKDFSSVLGAAKVPVNLFKESEEASRNEKLTESIIKTLRHFERANMYWNMKLSAYGWKDGVTDKNEEERILKIYPEASKDAAAGGARMKYGSVTRISVDFLLPIVWREASRELNIAEKLHLQGESKASNEIEILKEENEKLKAENAQLKKQLEAKKVKGQDR
jgi:hypothetical protein